MAVCAILIIKQNLFVEKEHDLKVLIAGASGFIGKRLVAVLQVNYTVTVLGRDITNLKRLFRKPVIMPAWLIRLLLGEMGDCLLLKGQRVVPNRLIDVGYTFKYPELVHALHNLKDFS